MGNVREYNQVEVELIEKMRDIYAMQDVYTASLQEQSDALPLAKFAAEALFPEEAELSFSCFDESEPTSEAEQYLYETRQENALLFHWAGKLRGQKQICRLITCGGVDDGKSTVIGRILYEAASEEEKAVIQSTPEYLRKDKTVDYAMLAGTSVEEARQGITVHVSYSRFDTPKGCFLMADVPGHEEYTCNMAYAAKSASLAILLISANKGIVPQTRRHARICRFMGISKMIFAINKMDMVDYDKEVYQRVQREIAVFMSEYKDCEYQIIPIAAKAGDNIKQKSVKMSWYVGVTLLDAITDSKLPTGKRESFYMPVQRICKSSQILGKEIKKRVIQGTVMGEEISVGEEIMVYPTMQKACVTRLYHRREQVECVACGQPTGVEIDCELDVARGYYLSKEDKFDAADCFEADILWISDNQLRNGIRYRLRIGAKEVSAVVTKIFYRVDVNTGDHKLAEHVTKNGMARVEMHLSEAVAAACVSANRILGTFLLLDKNQDVTLGYGNVIRTVSEEVFLENGKAVTREEREESLGQKAGLILFPDDSDMQKWRNNIERYLLRMGFHTMQMQGEFADSRWVKRMLSGGLILLLSFDREDGCKDEKVKEFLDAENRILDLREEKFEIEQTSVILKKVKQWAARMLC